MQTKNRTLCFVLIVLLSFTALLGTLSTTPRVQANQGEVGNGVRGEAIAYAEINFKELAQQAALNTNQKPERLETPFLTLPTLNVPNTGQSERYTAPIPSSTPIGVEADSPVVSKSFQALDDNNTSIPPDTHGAAGPNHLMTVLNTQVRIQDRNGTNISTVTLDQFWQSVAGVGGTFDPKILYDPYAKRWIFTACDDSRSATSGILIGVSLTDDPTGTWKLFKIDADPADTLWADYPSFGFNKNWIVVQLNMFTTAGAFTRSNVYVFDKANLYNAAVNTATHTLFERTGIGGTQTPAITYDPNVETMYLVQNFNGNSGGSGFLKLYTITGSVGQETFTQLASFYQSANTWDSSAPSGLDFATQLGSAQKIQNNDARAQNVVYRNGSLWMAHTAFLPAGGAPTRSAIQWFQLNTNGSTIIQQGRVEDSVKPSFFAFPSIAVNAANEVMLGYSRFAADQFASANYAFRLPTDPAGTMQTDTVLKAGEASYFKTFSGTRNRWGDYSATMVDPLNDASMWTIQEYAATPSGGFDRWGTWWGQIGRQAVTTATLTSSPNPSLVGQSVTFTATVSTGMGQPSGTVVFKNNGTQIGTGTLNASGIATFTTSSLPQGNNSITAEYSGDTLFKASTSASVNQVVNTTAVNTGTQLTSSPNPSKLGQVVVFTATVSVIGGPGTPSGTVTFTEGLTVLGTTTLNASGVATFSTSALSAGSHIISATYGGASGFNGSTSNTVTQVVIDPFIVTQTTDNGAGTTLGSLSFALAEANTINAATPVTITFNLSGGGNTITFAAALAAPLSVRSNVSILGGTCGVSPQIVLNGNGVAGVGLRLNSNNTIRNIEVRGFGEQQITALTGGGNVLQCTKASKS